MPFEAATIEHLVTLLMWACLSVPIWRHKVFKQVFLSQEVLFNHCTAAGLTFAPNLFDTIQAANPPPVSFFRGLSLGIDLDDVRLWAIYVIVLEKPGAQPLVYIGSGTAAKNGVRTRLRHYVPGHSLLPTRIPPALAEGYTIGHKGLLAWCPIPSAGDVPRLRLLFIALEAAMSFCFWTMYCSFEKDFAMGSCCPWPRASFTYGGLCSHSALCEGVHGDLSLTQEQLENIAAAVKQKTKDYMAAWRARQNEEDPQRIKDYMLEWRRNLSVEDMQKLKERVRKTGIEWVKNNPVKNKAKQAAYVARRKTSKLYYCAVCRLACSKPYEFARHNRSSRHLKRVKEFNAGVARPYSCDVCGYAGKTQTALDRHKTSEIHHKRVARAAANSSSGSD